MMEKPNMNVLALEIAMNELAKKRTEILKTAAEIGVELARIEPLDAPNLTTEIEVDIARQLLSDLEAVDIMKLYGDAVIEEMSEIPAPIILGYEDSQVFVRATVLKVACLKTIASLAR